MEDRRKTFVWIALTVLVVCGGYLRFHNLGKLDLWIDEPYHVYSAESLNESGQPLLPSGMRYNRALLYSRLVAVSFRIFGIDEFSVRFPSALFGVLCIPLIFFIGKALFGRRVGLLAAFFLAFSYFALAWSRISRFYTLFQFLYMLGVYVFYKGFEYSSELPKLFQKSRYLKSLKIHWVWLISGLIVLAVAYGVHWNTLMFFPAVACYILLLGIASFVQYDLKTALRTKYVFSLAVILLIAIFGILFLDFLGYINFAFSYRPDWADAAKFQDRYFYYDFLTSNTMFPLSAFFLMGVIHIFTRMDKKAFFIFIQFAIPVGITSLIFSYKLSNYIFQVYPFFLILGAYGIINFYDDEVRILAPKLSHFSSRFPKSYPGIVKRMVFIVLFAWIPLTIWFKLGVRFPDLKAGEYNLVYTHDHWKWAADYVNRNRGEKDVIISTIPLTLMYYGLRSDYNLSHGLNSTAKQMGFIDDQGRPLDPYSGIRTILDADDLQNIIQSSPGCWLITDEYTLGLRTAVPENIAQFIDTHFQLVMKNATTLIYSWKAKS